MSLNEKSLARNKVTQVHNMLRMTCPNEWPWNLTPDVQARLEDILVTLYHKQGGKCAVTGVPLNNAYTGRYWGNRIMIGKRDEKLIYDVTNLQYYIRTASSKRKKGSYSREFLQFCVDYVNKNGGKASMPEVVQPSLKEMGDMDDAQAITDEWEPLTADSDDKPGPDEDGGPLPF